MNTKTMVKKYEAKGYGMEYPDWLKMMKAVVEQIPVKYW